MCNVNVFIEAQILANEAAPILSFIDFTPAQVAASNAYNRHVDGCVECQTQEDDWQEQELCAERAQMSYLEGGWDTTGEYLYDSLAVRF